MKKTAKKPISGFDPAPFFKNAFFLHEVAVMHKLSMIVFIVSFDYIELYKYYIFIDHRNNTHTE